MKLKPFKELVALSKEAFDVAMLPLRVRAAKAKADSELIRIEESMLKLEGEIQILAAAKELDFAKLTSKMDEYDLAERKHKQVTSIIADLFPATPA